MKYLKTYEDYFDDVLDVVSEYKKTSHKVDFVGAIDYVLNHCTEFLNNPILITRGIDTFHDYFVGDPTEVKRKSIGTKNFYTLIMDNHPNWKGFPKRSKSFICTLGKTHMGGTSDYIVIPEDNSIFGVCPSSDIYLSFNISVSQFTSSIGDFYKNFYGYMRNEKNKYKTIKKVLDDDDYNKFKKQINQLNKHLSTIDREEILHIMNQHWLSSNFISMMKDAKYKDNIWNDDLFRLITKKFSPTTITSNDQTFELLEYKDLKNADRSIENIDGRREIWTESPCLFVKINSWKNVRQELNDFLREVKKARY